MINQKLGRVAVVPKGEWSAGTYTRLDVVTHGGQGFICFAAETAEEPGTGDAWQLIAAKGKDFVYADFTEEQIAGLMKPATDAAAEVGKTNEEYKAMLTEQAKAFGDAQQARAKSYTDAELTRDGAYTKAETNRNAAYNEAEDERQSAERVRGENEGARKSAETGRDTAEKERAEAEGKRKQAETKRGTAETERDTAEKARVKAEDEREKAWTDLKADAEKSVSDAVERADAANKAATKAIAEVKATEAKLYPAAENILKGKVKETFVHVDDAFPSSLLGIEVEGACKQDGTPSPDNPVPIEVIENPIIHICGKNLLKVDDSSVTTRGVTTSSKDGVITLSGVATENGYSGSIAGVYLPNGAIGQKLSVKIYEISGTVPQVNLLNKRYGLLLSSTQSSTVLNEQIAYLTVNVIKGVTYDCKFYVSVEVYGDADSGKYSPFNETSTSFTLPSEHPYLAKLPDGTADEIVVDREGNVELVARMTRNTLTSWAGTAAGYFTCAISPSRANNSVLCTGGVKLTGQVEQGDVFVGAALGIVGYQPREGDTTDALNAKGLLLYYKLVTPNRYPLGKIEMPKAQDSIVNAWTDAEVTPRTGIEYTRDVNIVVANLESAIASITQG